jgi:sulfate permease, SulP family
VPDSRGRSLRARLRAPPVMGGLLPVRRPQVAADVLAGITLAAVSIPVALGYAKIAGMPVVTGLYTLLLPMGAFAIFGSSRHLVVGADSATAALPAAALAGLAAAGSPQYVRLAGLAALLAGGLLLLARLARLGFLANFLSRTVLVGFLAGVGIQVAVGQLPDMLGVTTTGKSTPARLVEVVRTLPQVHGADVAVSAGVIVIVLAARRIDRRIPGLLIAVIAAIIVSRAAGLAGHGDKHAEPPIYTLGSSSALVSRNAQIRPFCAAQPQRVHHRRAGAYSAIWSVSQRSAWLRALSDCDSG